MRNDLETMKTVLEGLSSRTSTSDGLAAERRPVPFANAVPVDPAPSAEDLRPVHDLRDTLQRRRSLLHYAQQPVRTDVILSSLGDVLARDRADWGLDDTAGELVAFVFAFRSEGAPAGVYRVTAGETAHLAGPDELGPPEDLGVQREFSTAAGIVALYADLDAADSWAGSHGYRVSLVRASMATYDFHLRCQALGLVGTVFGGLIPSSVRHLVQGDGVTRHPLLAATYAHPMPS
ncbi:tpaF [Streptomyces hesseae]|uniref:TpaF n=1 Tax=Streptomyces hesseae TaxID=3075519 RepID=A0ABU2SL60_9ACTN|nr:tpaF [Streptomyces sp. DSM 40473]MDT0448775.1 tpaF [Streptomyces sp. DSM 40473]